MRYFRSKLKGEKQSASTIGWLFGNTYFCNHPLYSSCTLYKAGSKGLAVIQQRFDKVTKRSWWSEIDRELVNDIYEAPNFEAFFEKYAGSIDSSNCFPTVTVRQIMWAMRLKPLPKQCWETAFDHKPL